MKRAMLRGGVVFLFWMSACSGAGPGAGADAPTPVASTAPPTAATIWFPPTDTSTPFSVSTITATPDGRPGIGATILDDHFANAELWSTRVANSGSVIVQDNRLTLAVREPDVTMISLRSGPLLADFYAEIGVHTSLCRDRDEYGLIFRATAAANYYRFVLACNGLVRVDRVSGREVVIIQQATPSGDAPPGAPGDVRIGVWAVGKEMRLFLNDNFQFAVRDPTYRIGTLGAYARSHGDTPVTVTFRDLVAHEVSFVIPVPSRTPTRTPLPTSTVKPTP